jgi:hypothetical protein
MHSVSSRFQASFVTSLNFKFPLLTCIIHKPVCSPFTNSHGYMYPYVTLPLENMSCYPIQTDVVTTPTSEKGSWENINGEVRHLDCGALSSNPLTQTFRHIPRLLICRYPLIMASVTKVEHRHHTTKASNPWYEGSLNVPGHTFLT